MSQVETPAWQFERRIVMKISALLTSRYSLAFVSLICIAAIADAALRNPPWMRPPEPIPTAKSRPAQPKVDVIEKDGFRYISSNAIPDHLPGVFPNSGNPNTIREQQLQFRMTLHPTFADELTHAVRYPMGVAINGVPFEPGTAEVWNFDRDSGWNYDAMSGKIHLGLDHSHAHVQPTGLYHYHGIPQGVVSTRLQELDGKKDMILVGYAADGFPIYTEYGYREPNNPKSGLKKLTPSWQLKEGNRPHTGRDGGPGGKYDGTFTQDFEFVEDAGDLDKCNGRHGVTPEYPDGIYYYVLTDTYPFIPRYLRGEPDPSFSERRGRSGRSARRPGAGFRPPPPRRPSSSR